jgi:hypothetical protein
MIKKIQLLGLFLVLAIIANAQGDVLLELNSNNTIKAYYNANVNNPDAPFNKKRNNKALLTLPFIDDFSQEHIYPNQDLWQDINVHVNSNFADNPVTYGVATFDGLDSTGTPYDFSNPTSYGPADTLTSQPIDITTVLDSVFLSFYFQPQGMGNKPETKDSLTLQFFRKRDSTWVRMWGMQGAPNQPFEKAMIAVDTSFQNDEFQFRFINWATLSGNVDHWNIDYVYLDESRNHADTALNDVSFITNHHSMLDEFTAMPWSHYKTDSINFMAKAMDVIYKNNHSVTYPVFYKYQVIDNNGAGPIIETYPSTTSSKNVAPYDTLKEPQGVYDISPVFVNDFYFPTDGNQTKVFQIKNYFDLNSITDDHVKNDTVLSYQVFGSYYAYDDGSAENGYGVQGIGSKLAHEFDIKANDTLTAFQIYFSPIMNNLSAETFRLKVWSSLSPEVVIYSQPATQFTSPIYSNMNSFLNYKLDNPLYLTAGTYYIGWEKISQEFLNVGWDQNTDNSSKVHFNAVGVWQTASFPGSLMLRPVFGSYADPIVDVEETNIKNEIKVFPNPAKSVIQFSISEFGNYDVEMFDMKGKVLLKSNSSLTDRLNTSNIANGIYFIRFTNTETKHLIHKKIVISK